MTMLWGNDSSQNVKWGDADFDGDYENEMPPMPPPKHKVKEFKINKRVLERKKWRKFGDCQNLPPGPEQGVTILGEEVVLEYLHPRPEKQKKKVRESPVTPSTLCRYCAAVGDHFTQKCPFRRVEKPAQKESKTEEDKDKSSDDGKDRYVIPSLRRGRELTSSTGSDMDSYSKSKRDETATIRVTNLSEEAKESDLQDLFRKCGPISRIYLAKDKSTGLSKGFAFINFVHREDAARAMEKYQGYGYDHLILRIEWAKPSSQ